MAVGLGVRAARVLALAALALGGAGGAGAEGRHLGVPRPLEHHATVLNGDIRGSAFQIADGVAVTNAHVVQGLAPGSGVVLVASDRGRVRTQARLIATSPRMDLALLAVPGGFMRSIPEADASADAGTPLLAAGVDAGEAAAPGLELAGFVLAPQVRLAAFGPGLVARIPGVRPGFSGGPVFDRAGALVGMTAAIRPGPPTVAATGFGPARGSAGSADEAFVLRAAEIRAEVRRLLEPPEQR